MALSFQCVEFCLSVSSVDLDLIFIELKLKGKTFVCVFIYLIFSCFFHCFRQKMESTTKTKKVVHSFSAGKL